MIISGFGYGIKKSTSEVITGVVATSVYGVLANMGLIPYEIVLVFNVLSILGVIFLIEKAPFWSLTYLIGWVIGIIFMISVGLLSWVDITIYIAVSIVSIMIKLGVLNSHSSHSI